MTTNTTTRKKYIYLGIRFDVNDVSDTRYGEFMDYHRLSSLLKRLTGSNHYPIPFKEFRVFELNFSYEDCLDESMAQWILYFKILKSEFTEDVVNNTLECLGLRKCDISLLSTKGELAASLSKLPQDRLVTSTPATPSFFIKELDTQA